MSAASISIVLRVRNADGSRTHHTAVTNGNGRLKPHWGVVGRQPVHLPGSVYYLRYRQNGKRVWERIGTDPALALTRKLQREHQLAGTRLGLEAPAPASLTPTNPKAAAVPSRGCVSVQVAIVTYTDRIEKMRGVKTADSYRQHLGTFTQSCTKQHLDELTRQDVQAYIMQELRRGMAAKTIHNRLVTLKAFLRKHHQDGSIVSFSDAPRVHRKLPHVYSQSQVQALLAASGPEDRLTWEVFLAAGLREQELSYLCWEDVNVERGWLHLRAKPDLGFQLKDAEERQIPLPKELMAKLAARRAEHPKDRLVFPTPEGKPDGHLLRRLKELVFRAGINCGQCTNRAGVSCAGKAVCGKWQLHSFRRTAATRWHEAGLSVPTVQRLLGHSDIETTMSYLSAQDFNSEEFRASIDEAFANLKLAA